MIFAVAELKNINSAASNEHLKIGEKREKKGYFVTSNGHHRRRGAGGAEIFFGDSTFYASQHLQIWSKSERYIYILEGLRPLLTPLANPCVFIWTLVNIRLKTLLMPWSAVVTSWMTRSNFFCLTLVSLWETILLGIENAISN